MATKVVGLDFGSRSVKLCESAATLRATDIVGYDYEELTLEPEQRPAYDQLAEAAQRLLIRKGLMDETILCSPPAHIVSFLELTLPFDSAKKIESVLMFEVDDRIPLDVEDVIFDYHALWQADGETHCLVAYAKRTELEGFLNALMTVGIDPREVSFGPLLLGATPAIAEQANLKRLIIDLGHHTTHVALFDNNTLTYVRDVPVGTSGILTNYMETFQLDLQEAQKGLFEEGGLTRRGNSEREDAIHTACVDGFRPLLRELKRTWLTIASDPSKKPDEILLVGGGSMLTGVTDMLSEAFRFPVSTLVPFSSRHAGPTQQDNVRLFAKAAALTNVKGSSKTGRINLRQGEFAYTGDFSQIRGRLITTSLGVIVCLIFFALMGISKKRLLEAKNVQLKQEVANITKEVLGVESTEVSALTKALDEDFNADFSAIPPRSVTDLLHDISTELDTDLKVDIDRIELNLERKSLVLRGKTPQPSDVEALTDALEKMKCFRDVQQERVEAAGENTRFRLSATASCDEEGSS